MKLPIRDYPIGHMGAGELETEAWRLERVALAIPDTGTDEQRHRRRLKRAETLYAAVLCACCAREIRGHSKARVWDDLTERQRKRAIENTDKAAKSGTHIEEIIA